jgi:Holliday junction resolvasome RuvABC endonuclease subunit
MIIGIDPSLTNTAVCWGGADGAFEMRCFGSKAAGRTVHQRLGRYENLVAQVDALLQGLGPIEGVFIEGYSMGSKWGREEAGEYGGLLRWHLIELTPLVVEVSPSTLKKFTTGTAKFGKGQAKDMMIAHLTKRYGVLLNSNDEYDAFGLYRLGLCYAGLVDPATAGQALELDKMRAPKVKKPRKKKKAPDHSLLAGQEEPDCPW